jgi:hypothetical protein
MSNSARLAAAENLATPPAFRDLLISIAENAALKAEVDWEA